MPRARDTGALRSVKFDREWRLTDGKRAVSRKVPAQTVSSSSSDHACAFPANKAFVAAQVVLKSSEFR